MRLGAAAAGGDLICLVGDLGAGKTTLTQGIGEGLGLAQAAVTSPTFTLVAEHYEGRIPLYHIDAYRLAGPAELYHLGFEDYLLRADGLLVVEWADRVAEGLPADRLEVALTEDADRDDQRSLGFSARGPRAVRLLGDVLAAGQEAS